MLILTILIPCNNNDYSDYRAHGIQNYQLERSVSMQKSALKNIDRVLRYLQKCIWVVQRFLLQATISDHENENGAQKNVHIFKSNAPILLKLGVGLDHMYTKGWIFFRSLCVMSSWYKTTPLVRIFFS